MWPIVGIVVVVYLIHLNGFLRGRNKVQIDAVLSVCWAGFAISLLVISGWRIAVAWIVASFLLGFVLRPLAKVIAGKILQQGASLKALGYFLLGLAGAALLVFLQPLLEMFSRD